MRTVLTRATEIRNPTDGPIFMVRWWLADAPTPHTKTYRTAEAAAERIAELRADGIEPRVWRSRCTWREVEL